MSLPYRLKPADYFDHTVAGSDGTYLYQFNNTAFARALLTDRGTMTNIAVYATAMSETPDLTTLKIMSTGTMLIIGNTTNIIMRSTDGGVTWADSDTAMDHSGSSWNRSIAELTMADGSKRIYVGEYNTSGSGTVKLYESKDDGATFSVINTWIYDSGAQHLHCVLADPYDAGKLYLGFGDSNDFCGVLKWDSAVGDWADVGNKSCVDIVATPITGFTAVASTTVASQRYRVTDIIFTPERLYTFSDASISGAKTAATLGVWKFNRNLESWVNLNSEIISYTEISGLTGIYVDGQVVVVPYVSNTSGTDNEFPVYATRDGDNCKKVGVIHTDEAAAVKNIRGVFNVGSEVFVGMTPQGGKGTQKGTCSFTVTDESFLGPEPDILHPVFWVDDTTGDDSTGDGETPRTAWKSIFKALRNDQNALPFGACIMLGINDYAEAGFTLGGWDNFGGTYAVEATKPVQVRGEGKASTSVDIDSGANGITFDGTFTGILKVILSDLTWKYTGTETGSVFLGSTTRAYELVVSDSDIGDGVQVNDELFFVRNGTITAYRSRLRNTSIGVTAEDLVKLTDAGYTGKFTGYGCILDGGNYAIDMDNDNEIALYNCVMKGYRVTGIRTNAGTNKQPIARASVFHSEHVENFDTPFDDNNSMTYTQIDHCIFDKSSSTDGVTDAELGSNSVIDANVAVTGDVYTDPANDDYTPAALTEANTAFRKGGGRPLTGTYSGGLFNAPATIGCDDTEQAKKPARS